jgi:antitoxin VapB
MSDKAKLFVYHGHQAIQLPEKYGFKGNDVFIRRDEVTGDIILSERPQSWDGFFAVRERVNVPKDFLEEDD